MKSTFIEKFDINKLIPYERNPRKIPQKAIDAVAKSIRMNGALAPIEIGDDFVILAGHTRLKAYKELGYKEVHVLHYDGLTKTQKKTYRIASNKTSEYTEWDDEILAAEMKDIELQINKICDSTGISETDLRKIVNEEPIDTEPQMSKADELQKKWQVKRGDIWRIGVHRLMCGDSTSADDVARLMGGGKADMVFTDPPYGVSIGDKNKMLNTFQKAGRCLTNIENDTMKPDELYNVLLEAFKITHDVMADHASIYLTAPQGGRLGMMMMKDAGLEIKHILNWIKSAPTFSMGRLDYDYKHEPILYTWKKKHVFYGEGKYKSSCWEIDKPRKCGDHPTMKPVELYENAILNSSEFGMMLYEPFAGSGTAFVACQNLSRIVNGIEISPAYCSVILERMKTAFTDIKIEKIQ